MNLTQIRRALVPSIAAVALAASVAACGSNSGSGNGGGSSTIAAGGSSAQDPAQSAWRSGFSSIDSSASISYDAVGSGDGRTGFTSGKYAFIGTDSALASDEIAAATKQCGAAPIEFPAFISPIDVIYNVKGVSKLNLDASTLAKIFSGKITSWNDPAIQALNKGATLPSTKIVPVHRSDSSGTTDNFTDYLNQAAPADWKTAHDSDWPTTTGESGEKTAGMVSAVKAADGGIGYADDSGVQGQGLGVANIKVGSTFVAPSAAGAAADLAASKKVPGTPASIITYQLNRTSTDPKTYPIFMASYEVACPSYSDSSEAATIKAFLNYIISENGQKAAAANAYSAILPAPIAAAAKAQIDKIS